MPPILPPGSGSELLSLRGSLGTMINISQIEKFTESRAPSGFLYSRKATVPVSYP
jgi:hypothetical protein